MRTKTLSLVALALASLVSARAQVLHPEAVRGAVMGGIAGAIIGNNSGSLDHDAWRGAAYGAGAGLLLGSLAGEANARNTATQVPVPDYPRNYVYRNAPGYLETPVYAQDAGTTQTVYAPQPVPRRDYRVGGVLLGALAGAIIGNNSGSLDHDAWRGAAYGAGLGYVLGSVAEHSARRREASTPQPVAVSAPAPQPAPANPPPSQPAAPPSAMAAANELFGRR